LLLSDKDANATMKKLLAMLCTCGTLLLPPGAAAQASDPLKSAACADALAALQAARAAGGTAQAQRDQAALACLGGGNTPQRSARVLQAPLVVPAPVITPPAVPPPLAAPQLPPPPVAIGRPPSVTHCDAGGCWGDDGRGLRHIGPNLAGPNGLCTPQGGLVYCP
jgi:hypothetical protein